MSVPPQNLQDVRRSLEGERDRIRKRLRGRRAEIAAAGQSSDAEIQEAERRAGLVHRELIKLTAVRSMTRALMIREHRPACQLGRSRAPRASAPRTRGSRRRSAARSSSDDPGGGDPDPAGGCRAGRDEKGNQGYGIGVVHRAEAAA